RSREAAQEENPRRKSWVEVASGLALDGAKEQLRHKLRRDDGGSQRTLTECEHLVLTEERGDRTLWLPLCEKPLKWVHPLFWPILCNHDVTFLGFRFHLWPQIGLLRRWSLYIVGEYLLLILSSSCVAM